mgnify:FL=1
MKMRKILIIWFVLFISCESNNSISNKEHSMYWHKNSAEYKALCIQAYNIARKKLDIELSKDHSNNLAIVVDIDETILDNTPYNEMLIEKKESYNQKNWSDWVNKKIAKAIPGSIDFLTYADSSGVEIIYLSNRKIENYKPTKLNLQKLGFPFKKNTQMLLRENTRDKKSRRNAIEEYKVIMYLGDNLGDFEGDYFNKNNKERWDIANSEGKLYGDKFILIPNLIYGDWERGFND